MPNKAHIGIKATPAEYVEVGRMICKQRKYIAKNPEVTRKRHFKIYPGVNVKVMKSTSLQASVSGRVKITHDVHRDVMIMNVLAEPREELLREDLWRYRTEHVECMEENKLLIHLRSKALPVFGKEGGWLNQAVGPKPMKVRISHKNDTWNNYAVQDPMEVEPFAYPLPRGVLARHIKKVRARQAGMPDEKNDPGFEVRDIRFPLFKGQTPQR
jgi:ribosomal protein L27